MQKNKYSPAIIRTQRRPNGIPGNAFKVSETPDRETLRLSMFPYQAASYPGHVRNYTIGDVYFRYSAPWQARNVLTMGGMRFCMRRKTRAMKKQVARPSDLGDNIDYMRTPVERGLAWRWDVSREFATCTQKYVPLEQWAALPQVVRGRV